MRFLFNVFDIVGAVVSSQMTGDLRRHAAWTLKFFLLLSAIGYFVARS